MTVNVSKPAINVREKLAELDKPTGIAGEAMLRAETPQEQFNLIGAGRRNLIINGAMEVAQRGTSATGLTATYWAYPCVDRIKVFNTCATVSTSQETDAPSGFGHSFKLSLDASASPVTDDKVMIRVSPIEGQAQLMGTIGQPMTLSFWVKSNKTGSFSCDIVNHDNQRNCQVVYTVDKANTWEYKTGTVYSASDDTFDMDSGLSLTVDFMCTYGPSLTSGSPKSTMVSRNDANAAAGATTSLNSAGDYIQITGVQLELGKVATPFEYRSYGEELALCRRYYQRVNLSRYSYMGYGKYQVFYMIGPIQGFDTHLMRTSPTASFSTSTGAAFTVVKTNIGGTHTPTSIYASSSGVVSLNGGTSYTNTTPDLLEFNSGSGVIGIIEMDAEI